LIFDHNNPTGLYSGLYGGRKIIFAQTSKIACFASSFLREDKPSKKTTSPAFRVGAMDGKYPRSMISSGSLINGFISNFNLDFSQKHNQTFSGIDFDVAEGTPIAIISISKT